MSVPRLSIFGRVLRPNCQSGLWVGRSSKRWVSVIAGFGPMCNPHFEMVSFEGREGVMVMIFSARQIRRVSALVMLAISGWSSPPVEGQSPHPRPSSFFGTITVEGGPLASGSEVAAWIGDTPFAVTVATDLGGETRYRLDVPGDVAETPGVEGGSPGDEIRFRVAGGEVSTTAIWVDGSHVVLDLEATFGPDLSLDIDDGASEIVPGDVGTYELTVVHHGGVTAANTALRFSLPTGVSLVSASDGATQQDGEVLWPHFDLAGGMSAVRSADPAADYSRAEPVGHCPYLSRR